MPISLRFKLPKTCPGASLTLRNPAPEEPLEQGLPTKALQPRKNENDARKQALLIRLGDATGLACSKPCTLQVTTSRTLDKGLTLDSSCLEPPAKRKPKP